MATEVKLLKKEELVKIAKESLGLKTTVLAEKFVKDIDTLYEAVTRELEINEGIKFGSYVRIDKVIQAEREYGERELNGKKIPAQVVPAHPVIKVKKTGTAIK